MILQAKTNVTEQGPGPEPSKAKTKRKKSLLECGEFIKDDEKSINQ